MAEKRRGFRSLAKIKGAGKGGRRVRNIWRRESDRGCVPSRGQLPSSGSIERCEPAFKRSSQNTEAANF